MKIETALISVSDRGGLVELARGLKQLGVEILSTGGTGKTLQENGVPVLSVSEYTGFPEILDGRVKTLHPRVHGGILARHDDEAHREVLRTHGIRPIGMVVVNLYPFARTVARSGVSFREAVEQIDIGGPTLIRAAAKNCEHVAVVVDPEDYPRLLEAMTSGEMQVGRELRLELARKAFRHTAAYDAGIASYLESGPEEKTSTPGDLPLLLGLGLRRHEILRYGENPHQRGAVYRFQGTPPGGFPAARQHQGKQLSYNNLLDLEAAWSLCREFDDPFCAIVKHNNPCGAALGSSAREAYEKALACDPVSAFGSVVGFNRTVDGETAESMKSLFVEAVVASAFSEEALEVFSAKKNLRVMEMPSAESPLTAADPLDFRRIEGGFLVQDRDFFYLKESDLRTVTRRQPEDHEKNDLLFAWMVCKHVKSNAVVLARDGGTVGIGAGQMSRVDSVRLSVQKARPPLEGTVMASDAFFPFRDGIDAAAEKGVRAVIQPGGSVRDEDVIRAADEHGMTMLFTGVRHFRH